MDFFKKVVSTVTSSIAGLAPGFPYLTDELLTTTPDGIWTIHKGHNVSFKKDDPAGSVTVFSCDLAGKNKLAPFARNAFKRLKMLRHPRILRLLEGVEVDGKIYFATEAVVPFSRKQAEILQSDDWESLRFLNEEALIIHGNVRSCSLFVTASGEVKLGGFEFASTHPESYLVYADPRKMSLFDSEAWPPEVSNSNWQKIVSNPIHSIDGWMFAKLVKDLLGNRMPRLLQSFCASALSKDPASRHSSAILLEASQSQTLFANQLIDCDRVLSRLILIGPAEQEAFFSRTLASLNDLPRPFLQHKLIPSIIESGTSSSSNSTGGGQLNSLEGMRLVLRAGLLLEEPEAFESLVEPFYISLFERMDRAVRLLLLENLDGEFLGKLSRKAIQEKIFAHFVTGFTDAMPELRERTLKASILLIPSLTSRQINNDLLRHYAKLQTDEQPGIRVNTIICMGKMVSYFEASTKRKVFSAAIARALQDPFPPTKAAGLQTLLASLDAFEPDQLARGILPTVCNLLVDPDPNARKKAFSAVRTIIDRIEEASKANEVAAREKGEEQQDQPQQTSNWWGLEKFTSQVSSVQEKYLGRRSSVSKATSKSHPQQTIHNTQSDTPTVAPQQLPKVRSPPQQQTTQSSTMNKSKPMKLSKPLLQKEGWEDDDLAISPSIPESPKPSTPNPKSCEDTIIASLNISNDWASEEDPWA